MTDIKKVLELHAAWLRSEEGGVQASLSGASLVGASLIGADLSYADFRGTNLSYSDFRGTNLSYADFRGANLGYSDFRGANLIEANLSDADLGGVNLSKAVGIERASVSWHGHGDCGRELLCVRIDGSLRYFCGCFAGGADELQAYIDNDTVDLKTIQSRRKALWIVSDLMVESPWEEV